MPKDRIILKIITIVKLNETCKRRRTLGKNTRVNFKRDE
jgi:hypothetical protein